MPLDPRDKATIIARYEARMAEGRGDSYTLGTSLDAMNERYKAVVGLVKPDIGSSLLDVGCGFGHLREYLPPSITSYTGVDIVEAMLPEGDDFKVLDITADPIDDYDYIICLAVFNNLFQHSDNKTIVREAMKKMFDACRVGISIDFIEHTMLRGPSRDGKLFYYIPGEMCAMAYELTDLVVLKRDYTYHEAMLFLYKGRY